MPKLSLFYQPPAPQGPAEYISEDDPRKQTGFLDTAADFVRGLGYFPTEPLPKDASKSYAAGAAVAHAAPLLGPALKGLGMAAPLITIYKDAAGIPSQALREGGTQEFLQSARALGSDAMQNASQVFAERYPRIAAHMRIEPSLHATNDYRAVTNVQPFGVESPVPIGVSNRGLQQIEESPRQAMDTMFHEGTHVAQALGNRYTDLLYRLANKLPGRYQTNPFENSARLAGQRAVGDASAFATSPAIRGLRQAATDVIEDPTGGYVPGSETWRAAKNILDILNARAK